QPGAAGSLKLILAAAARAVRGVPRGHVPGRFSETGTVVMADDGRAIAALGPVATGGIAAGGRVLALRVRAGQDVVYVDRVAAAAERIALLGQPGLLVDVGRGRVQVIQVRSHHDTLDVFPWP